MEVRSADWNVGDLIPPNYDEANWGFGGNSARFDRPVFRLLDERPLPIFDPSSLAPRKLGFIARAAIRTFYAVLAATMMVARVGFWAVATVALLRLAFVALSYAFTGDIDLTINQGMRAGSWLLGAAFGYFLTHMLQEPVKAWVKAKCD